MSEQQSSYYEVLLAIGRLEGKMDAIQSDFRATKESIGEIESRVRILEGRLAWGIGACAVISTIIPYIVNVLIH